MMITLNRSIILFRANARNNLLIRVFAMACLRLKLCWAVQRVIPFRRVRSSFKW